MTRLSPCCDISYITWQVLCSVVFAFEIAGCLWCLADWVVLSTSSECVGRILILWYLKQHLPESWGEFSFCQVYKSVSAGVWNSVIILSPLGKCLQLQMWMLHGSNCQVCHYDSLILNWAIRQQWQWMYAFYDVCISVEVWFSVSLEGLQDDQNISWIQNLWTPKKERKRIFST